MGAMAGLGIRIMTILDRTITVITIIPTIPIMTTIHMEDSTEAVNSVTVNLGNITGNVLNTTGKEPSTMPEGLGSTVEAVVKAWAMVKGPSVTGEPRVEELSVTPEAPVSMAEGPRVVAASKGANITAKVIRNCMYVLE